MNMKKLMAGVVAGALAVSTLAASAFAADFPAKISNKAYTIPVSAKSDDISIEDAPETGVLRVALNTVSLSATGSDYSYKSVETYAITLTYFEKENSAPKTKTVKVEAGTDAYWSNGYGGAYLMVTYTTGKSATKDISNLDLSVPVSYEITAVVKGPDKDTVKALKDVKSDLNCAADAKAFDDWSGVTWLGGADVKATADDVTEVDAGDQYLTSFKVKDVLDQKSARDFVNGGKLVIDIDASTLKNSVIGGVVFTDAAGKEVKTEELLFTSGKTHYEVEIPAAFIAIDEGGEGIRGDIMPQNDATITIKGLGDVHNADDKAVGFSVFLSNSAAPAQTEDTSASDTQVSEDDPTNTSASDTQAPASSDDNGNTNAGTGDDKNQPTGVALAVIPAIVAAAGVVIAKKRG